MSAAERWTARRVRMAAFPPEFANRTNPVPDTPKVQAEARAHWADHCASCHANDGSGDSQMGRRTYPPAPDMRRSETQQLTDGESFYIIQNGVRPTAMPAWASSAQNLRSRRDGLVEARAFHPPSPNAHVRGEERDGEIESQGPEDRKEEEEEEKFLKGEDIHELQTEHHHH